MIFYSPIYDCLILITVNMLFDGTDTNIQFNWQSEGEPKVIAHDMLFYVGLL